MDETLGVPAPDVSTMELGDELSVFHAGTGTALTLNRTASDVFALADGDTTVPEAVSILARAYGVPAEGIADDVAAAVRLLREAGVLVATNEPTGEPTSTPTSEPTSEPTSVPPTSE